MLLASSTPALPGLPEESGRELDALARQRRDLQREVQLLQLETGLAKTKAAYAVLDPATRRLSLRVRGRTMKETAIHRIFVETQAGGTEIPADLYGRVYKLLDRYGKEIPVALTGSVAAPEPPAGSEAAAQGSPSSAPMIAPDPPPRYLWKLDQGLSIYVLERDVPADAWTRRAEAILVRAKQIGRLWRGLTGRADRGTVLYLVMDGEQSREMYRSLLPGQSLILLTPDPAP